jgi:hypothetical protein
VFNWLKRSAVPIIIGIELKKSLHQLGEVFESIRSLSLETILQGFICPICKMLERTSSDISFDVSVSNAYI